MTIAKEVRREAYDRINEMTMEQKVLTILSILGKACGGDIMRYMGTKNPNNVRPRLSTLAKNGLVAEIDKLVNSDGRPETVYEITNLGHAHLRGLQPETKKAALRGANTEDSGCP